MEKVKWVDPKLLKPHPKNPNKHSPEQIDRIIKLIDAYGWRHPIIVSKKTGFVIVGHGRLEAAIKNKDDQVPVDYQEFKDDDEEYGFMVADNAIAGWSELDLGNINLELSNLGPDFDIDILGLKNFLLEPADKGVSNLGAEWNGMPEFTRDDKTAYRSVIVHFYNQDGVNEFAKLVSQNITDKTRMLWFPQILIERTADKVYES